MTTQLADLRLPSSFSAYSVNETAEKSRLVQSGVIAMNGKLTEALATGPDQTRLRWYIDIDGGDNIPDDTTNLFTDQQGISSYEENVFLHPRIEAFSDQDYAVELNGDSPIEAIRSSISAMWARRWQKIAIATLQGIVARGETDNAGSFRIARTIDFDTQASVDAAGRIVLQARDVVGDSGQNFVAIAAHSRVVNAWRALNLIADIPDARGEIVLATYQGLEVIEDDGLPVSGSVYTTYLLGPGALQGSFGIGRGMVADEIDRVPAQGRGGGQTQLWTRRRMSVAPKGFSWTPNRDTLDPIDAPNGQPTETELADDNNWTDVIGTSERNTIPIVEIALTVSNF